MSEVDVRLCLVLVEKIREAPADDLGLVREYIKEIRELAGRLPKSGQLK